MPDQTTLPQGEIIEFVPSAEPYKGRLVVGPCCRVAAGLGEIPLPKVSRE